MSTQHNPTREAEQQTTDPLVPFDMVKIRAHVRLSCNSLKPPLQASDHSNIKFISVKFVKGETEDANPSKNLL